jgi:hypothetical protein
MAYLESGRAKGKVVVTMAGPPPISLARTTLTQIPSTERHGRE